MSARGTSRARSSGGTRAIASIMRAIEAGQPIPGQAPDAAQQARYVAEARRRIASGEGPPEARCKRSRRR